MAVKEATEITDTVKKRNLYRPSELALREIRRYRRRPRPSSSL
jgi:hypothetical protein